MKSLPIPAAVAALAGVIALPFSAPAAGMLLLTAGLGSMIHLDYVQRQRRVRLPKLATQPRRNTTSRGPFTREAHQLAA
jgi:hypothetical protein